MCANENKMTKIILFNTYWPLNIGNAFVDLGAMQSIHQALDKSIIYIVSDYPPIMFKEKFRSPLGKIAEKMYRNPNIKRLNQRLIDVKIKTFKKDRLLKNDKNRLESHCFNLGEFIRANYAIFSGMVLWDSFIKQHKSTFLALKKKGTKIILNGVGGPFYSENEVAVVSQFLKEVRPYALISRDEKAFKYYGDLAEHSYNGIDCAFFINDHYAPPKLDIPNYIILNFDKLPEPKVNLTDKLVVRVHHYSSSETYSMPKKYFIRPNTVVSDSPYDYLTLYANASAIFSDRVHACVVTLSYGRPAKLFVRNDDVEIFNRMLLFKKIGAHTINDRLTYPDIKRIEKEKEKQIRFLHEVLARV
jgi:hypothetical protein